MTADSRRSDDEQQCEPTDSQNKLDQRNNSRRGAVRARHIAALHPSRPITHNTGRTIRTLRCCGYTNTTATRSTIANEIPTRRQRSGARNGGLDVEGWVKERFVGDFEAVAKSRNAVKNLALFDAAATTDTGALDAAAWPPAGCLAEVPGLDALMDIIGGWRVTKVVLKVHEVANTWNIAWSAARASWR
ncbi:hypothetical protein FPZ12_013830 [Amycolatopsis acidicola]|uniref:Uncharacterized protein n=1 Tax=Amycolatopsis acidicola TaxID=2596893 RepID=A0A5N0V5E1_9PSEU|nr:hypothetical protein [Amycolatopsis acidicola]KAA9161586.1 hypothetical protein FPZ12_013830 [Amycolatopsis acidicola]